MKKNKAGMMVLTMALSTALLAGCGANNSGGSASSASGASSTAVAATADRHEAAGV